MQIQSFYSIDLETNGMVIFGEPNNRCAVAVSQLYSILIAHTNIQPLKLRPCGGIEMCLLLLLLLQYLESAAPVYLAEMCVHVAASTGCQCLPTFSITLWPKCTAHQDFNVWTTQFCSLLSIYLKHYRQLFASWQHWDNFKNNWRCSFPAQHTEHDCLPALMTAEAVRVAFSAVLTDLLTLTDRVFA